MYRTILFLSLGLLFVFSGTPAFSQESIDISIRSTPENPSPGAVVTLEVISYSIDLTQAAISWRYGGSLISSGIGNTGVTVTAPNAGIQATATATVSFSGFSQTQSITLSPGNLDVLWEGASSSVPPFYKGRPLLGVGGMVKVVAIPSPSAPRQSSFQWKRNGSVIMNASGAGRSSLIIEHSPFETSEKIEVRVSGGNFESNNTLSLTPQSLSLVAYPKKEGFVDFANGSKRNLSAKGSGAVFRFEPFFFSLEKGVLHDLDFSFLLNGENVFSEQPNELRLSKGAAGNQTISVELTTKEYSLQNLQRNFSFSFIEQ